MKLGFGLSILFIRPTNYIYSADQLYLFDLPTILILPTKYIYSAYEMYLFGLPIQIIRTSKQFMFCWYPCYAAHLDLYT